MCAQILELSPDSQRCAIGIVSAVAGRDGAGGAGAPIVFGLVDSDQLPAQFK